MQQTQFCSSSQRATQAPFLPPLYHIKLPTWRLRTRNQFKYEQQSVKGNVISNVVLSNALCDHEIIPAASTVPANDLFQRKLGWKGKR